jgi:hypothetical protein
MLTQCLKIQWHFKIKEEMVKIGKCKGENISNGELRKKGQGLIFM